MSLFGIQIPPFHHHVTTGMKIGIPSRHHACFNTSDGHPWRLDEKDIYHFLICEKNVVELCLWSTHKGNPENGPVKIYSSEIIHMGKAMV